jgi:hypothetical protein
MHRYALAFAILIALGADAHTQSNFQGPGSFIRIFCANATHSPEDPRRGPDRETSRVTLASIPVTQQEPRLCPAKLCIVLGKLSL